MDILGIARIFCPKVIMSLIVLGGIVGVVAVLLGKKVPGGFVPEEDKGYFMMGIILPDAASSDKRQDAVAKQVEGVLGKREGIESYTVINGYSILIQYCFP